MKSKSGGVPWHAASVGDVSRKDRHDLFGELYRTIVSRDPILAAQHWCDYSNQSSIGSAVADRVHQRIKLCLIVPCDAAAVDAVPVQDFLCGAAVRNKIFTNRVLP